MEFDLPRDCISTSDINTLFDLQENGLHLKIKVGNEWINEFPSDDGNFERGNGNICHVVSTHNLMNFYFLKLNLSYQRKFLFITWFYTIDT